MAEATALANPLSRPRCHCRDGFYASPHRRAHIPVK